MTDPLLQVSDLSVVFAEGGRVVRAVHHCSLHLERGEVLALVGESGSGKSTLARTIAGIVTPSAGMVRFRSHDLSRVAPAERRTLRRRMQMIFQDPEASLNPRHRVGTILAEPLTVIGYGGRAAVQRRIEELLALVRLDRAVLQERPRHLSGGEKQRIAIARALAMEPEVLIADEALASLDVSTAASIRELFSSLLETLDIAMLFISHDLATVRHFATRVAVMFAGEIVEQGSSAAVLTRPAHPYTRLLLASTPDPARRTLAFGLIDAIDRLPPAPAEPAACHYRPRCLERAELCAARPQLASLAAEGGHLARCHFRDRASPAAPNGSPT